jgi:hypothetical protein
MFQEIHKIVDIFFSSLDGISNIKKRRERTELIRCFLKLYFMLQDCVEDGKALLDAAGPDPEETLKKLSSVDSEEEIMNWTNIVRRQAARLYSIQGWIFQTPGLQIMEPELTGRIQEIIGYKGERVNSLSTIGSGLVITSMLGINDRETVIELVKSMYRKNSHGKLSVRRAKKEMEELSASLEQFRKVCNSLLSPDEIMKYSKVAKKAAIIN